MSALKIFVLAILIISCKHKEKVKVITPFTITTINNNKRDTTIGQYIECHQDGIYTLHTFVTTNGWQHSFTEEQDNSNWHFGNEQYAPYSRYISGDFNYIKSIKKIELQLALNYFPVIIKRQKQIDDTIKILNSIK
jgi:hypothetical protein